MQIRGVLRCAGAAQMRRRSVDQAEWCIGIYKYLYIRIKFTPVDSRFLVLCSAPVRRFAKKRSKEEPELCAMVTGRRRPIVRENVKVRRGAVVDEAPAREDNRIHPRREPPFLARVGGALRVRHWC